MKLKSKKSALLLSFTSLLLCFAMLAGSTFAWFTDTATTGVNQIKSGNLDIEVQYRTTADGEWKTLDKATELFGAEGTLFEPGHTRVVELKIENAGNLALKYKIGMNIASETVGTNKAGNPYKLSDYLKVAATGFQQYPAEGGIAEAMEWAIFQPGMESMWKEHPFTNFELEYASNGNVHVLQPGAAQILGIKVYMPDSVGNEANAKTTADAASIKFGLSVYATQYTTESDSFGTQYDKDATYPIVANNQAELEDVIANNNSVTIMTTAGTYTLPAIAGNKTVTILGDESTVIDMTTSGIIGAQNAGLDLTIEGATVQFANENYKGVTHSKKLTYKDCTITGMQFLYADEVEFVNCKFVQDTADYNVWTYGAGKVLFKDCEFECEGKAVLIYNEGAQSEQTVEFQSCKFNASASAEGKAAIEIDSYGTSYDVIIDQATADNVTGFGVGTQSKSSVWNVKRNVKPVTVTVAGAVVYNQ